MKPVTLLRRYVGAAYWWWESFRRSIAGSSVDENRYRRKSREDIRAHFDNVSLPHRGWLTDRLLSTVRESKTGKADILEVGCGWGPNLVVLAKRAPLFRLTGVDISPASIAEGQKRLTELNLSGISLVEGQADDLSAIEDASMDVVFTDAMLLYVGPDKIERTIMEMIRVARRHVFLLEMHCTSAGAGGYYMRDGWLRDYEVLLRSLVGDTTVRLEPMPPRLRVAGRWPQYGTLIEIDVRKARSL